MKLVKLYLVLVFSLLVGCGPGVETGSKGDANDPEISGTDDAQANEAEGTVETTDSE